MSNVQQCKMCQIRLRFKSQLGLIFHDTKQNQVKMSAMATYSGNLTSFMYLYHNAFTRELSQCKILTFSSGMRA